MYIVNAPEARGIAMPTSEKNATFFGLVLVDPNNAVDPPWLWFPLITVNETEWVWDPSKFV